MTLAPELPHEPHRPAPTPSPFDTLDVCKPPLEVSQETSNTHLSSSTLCLPTNGDQPLSADPAIEPPTVTNSSPLVDDWQPIRTYNGIKWAPTIAYTRNRTCPTCPVYAECSADVAAGDFAWCEDVIPADYALTNPVKPTYSTYWN